MAHRAQQNSSLAFNMKGITKDADEEGEVRMVLSAGITKDADEEGEIRMVLSAGSSFSWEFHTLQLVSGYAYKSEVIQSLQLNNFYGKLLLTQSLHFFLPQKMATRMGVPCC